MPDIDTVVNTYIATWNEPDADRRRALVEQAFAEDGSYVDPLMSGEGPDAIAAMIGGAQAQFPGHRFELAVAPDAHHDVVRFAWHLVGEADGTTVAVGQDFATLAGDGRLRSVVGFLEQPSA
jgi:hypothetical protein